MGIIRKQAMSTDVWQHVPDEADKVPPGDVVVSLNRWQKDRERLWRRSGRLGVRLKPQDEVTAIAGDLTRLSIVVLEFGAFTDGQGYSQAQLLRTRYGFDGEIRASGHFLRDQIFFMVRCGINSFQPGEQADTGDILQALAEFSVLYQPSADGAEPVSHRRTRAGHRL